MLGKIRALVLGSALLLLAACNPFAVLEGSDEAIETFHNRFSTGQLEEIWEDSHVELRDGTPLAEFTPFVGNLTMIFGAVESAERESFNISTTNGETVATIVMKTQFANGEGTETFMMQQVGDEWQLYSYNVVSPLLTNLVDPADEDIADIVAEKQAAAAQE